MDRFSTRELSRKMPLDSLLSVRREVHFQQMRWYTAFIICSMMLQELVTPGFDYTQSAGGACDLRLVM